MAPSKIVLLSALIAGATAFSTAPAFTRVSTALFNMEKGAGGMFDTRNPDAQENEDPRKSISAAPSFEEYMKQRAGGAPAPAPVAPAPAPAPAAAAPAAPAGPSSGLSPYEEYMMKRGGAAPAPAAAPKSGTPAPGSSSSYLDNL